MVSVTINGITYTNIKSLQVDKDFIKLDLNDESTLILNSKDVVDVNIDGWSAD